MLKNPLLIAIMAILFIGCSKNETSEEISVPIPKIELSTAKELSSFKITLDNMVHTGIIRNDSILYKLPSGTNLTSLQPEITISEKASVSPSSGQAVDFTNAVKYTVTAEDNSKKEYQALLDTYSAANEITSISFPGVGGYLGQVYAQNPADIDTMAYEFSYSTDITDLITEIEVSNGATIEPDPEGISDYSSPVQYIITAEDGSVNEILVIATNKNLLNVIIEGFFKSQFHDVSLGGDITFSVNELNPNPDSVTVRMFSDHESFDLVIKNINYDTKEITVTLPNSYRNNRFQLEVSIEQDNSDLSDGFTLMKGSASFDYVNEYFNNGNPLQINQAIWPGHQFNVTVYLKNDEVAGHEFFLVKNGVYYEMTVAGTFNNITATGIKLEMPNLPDVLPSEGADYQIVIRNENGDVAYDFINEIGSNIEVVFTNEPVVTGVNTTTLQKDESLVLMGTDLYTNYVGYHNSSVLINHSKLVLKKPFSTSYSFITNVLETDGTLAFDLSGNEYLQAGTYEVHFTSNAPIYPEVDTGITVTVTQPVSEHPSLQVTDGVLYSNTHASAPKQILLTFNENIENYEIKRIVTGSSQQVSIENYFTYPTTVLTGSMSDTDYSSIVTRGKDGYVVVEDAGVEYKIYFILDVISF